MAHYECGDPPSYILQVKVGPSRTTRALLAHYEPFAQSQPAPPPSSTGAHTADPVTKAPRRLDDLICDLDTGAFQIRLLAKCEAQSISGSTGGMEVVRLKACVVARDIKDCLEEHDWAAEFSESLRNPFSHEGSASDTKPAIDPLADFIQQTLLSTVPTKAAEAARLNSTEESHGSAPS